MFALSKIINIVLLSALISVFLLPPIIDARSGCCSHHGGVCGCGCCDGTSLSATCSPYYPQCNENVDLDYMSPVKNITPSKYNPPAVNYTYPANNYTNNDTREENDNSVWYGLGTLGIGGVIYYFYKKKR